MIKMQTFLKEKLFIIYRTNVLIRVKDRNNI